MALLWTGVWENILDVERKWFFVGVGSVREGEPQRTMPVKQAWPTLKTCHWQVFLTLRSADADQGLCPWSLVAFEKAPQNFMRPAALVFANVCVYEQNRCFPMTVNSGLDQIQALVAVTGLK